MKAKRARPRHFEDSMQITLIANLNYVLYDGCRIADVIYHIPNGGKRNALEAIRFKKMGVRAGVADLFLPIPIRSFHGAYFELKHGKNKPTEGQIEFGKHCAKYGYYYAVHYSWIECLRDVVGYLKCGDKQLQVLSAQLLNDKAG